jgi:urea transport system permease protein
MTGPCLARNPSVLWFILAVALFTLGATLMREVYGSAVISTSSVRTPGRTLSLCRVALAMDLVRGCAGILSLGHMAFFALGGSMFGMLLMHARTEGIVIAALANAPPPNPQEIRARIGTQIAGVVRSAGIPAVRTFAPSLPAQRARVVPVPGLLALVVGWLAGRSRVTGVHRSILRQAIMRAHALHRFRWRPGAARQQRPSGLQTIPGLDAVGQDRVAVWFLPASAVALALGQVLCAGVVGGRPAP